MSEEATLDDFAQQDDDSEKEFNSSQSKINLSRLEEYISIIKGTKPDRVSDERHDNSEPYLVVSTLKGEERKYTPDTDGPKATPRDTLMIMDGSKSGRVYRGEDGVIGSTMAAIRPEDTNSHYLRYFLESNFERLNSATKGSAVPHTDKDLLRSLEYPVYPLPEQRKIATVLYTVDRAIEKTEKIIEKQETVRRGTEQDLLTRGILEDGSLRSEASIEYKSSWVGKVPKEWDVRPYSELISDSSVGIVVKPTQYYDNEGEVPILRSKDISRDGIVDGDFEYMTQESNEENSNSRLEAGDVITVRSGEPGLSCVVPSGFDGSNCADLLISTPGELLDPHYAAMWINSREGRKQIDRFQAGLAQKHFNLGALRKLRVAVPPIEEQRRIVKRVSSITEAIDREKQYKTRLERLKRGLMQDLLSGTVRTTDTNIEVPEEIAQYG